MTQPDLFDTLRSSTYTRIASRRKQKGFSKSLSDIEFEEFKRFMDLGFIFSKKDKNSNLASIFPMLQRLGKNDDTYMKIVIINWKNYKK